MESISAPMVAATKLPVLIPSEFELWKMRIEQYFLMTDYALWEVIVNGDSPPPKRTVDGVEKTYPLTTADRTSNWLERLPTGSITTWEDLTTRFLAQFFLPGRTAKLRNDILMFQQHHGESLSEAWTRFKDLLQKVPHHGIDLWLQICSGPHDTQYCMEDPEQAFVEYASSRTDEAGGKWSITDRIAGALPSDTVKNLKLNTSLVLSARSYPTEDPQCSTQIHSSINAITIHSKQQIDPRDDRTKENEEEEKDIPENIHFDSSTPPDPSVLFITEKVLKLNSFFESLRLVPPLSNAELVCTKEKDGDVMFIKIVPKDDVSRVEEPKAREQEVGYFDIFPTRSVEIP
ncbi:MAK10-like protein [Tanacetum coccineum]